MPLPRHITATLNFARNNAVASCILYYFTEAEVDAEEVDDIASAIYDHFNGDLQACFEPETDWLGVNVVSLTSDARFEASSEAAPSPGSATAGDVLPEEDAVVIQRRTGLRGRGKNGRIFLPFVPEAFAIDSALTSAAITKYKALAAKIAQPIAAIEGLPHVLEPRQPNFKNNLLLPIVSCRVVDNTCSRRDRRTPKRYVALGAGGNFG